MKYLIKCNNCNKPLNSTNSVFIRISRYDEFGRRIKKKVFCTNCWDHATIFIKSDSKDKYYDFNQLPTDLNHLPVPDAYHGRHCMDCNHLIFKDYKERTGCCRLTRLYRRFSDICVYEEEKI